MFEFFKYFIYLVEKGLDNYDPLRDMLLDPKRYLTWRRYNDETARGLQYAGAIWDDQLQKWVILRFNPKLYFEEVDDWLSSQKGKKRSLGAFHPSLYQGLMRPKPPYSDMTIESWYDHKLSQFQAFYEENWGMWPAWLARELATITSAEARLKRLHCVTIDTLIGERGVVL